MGSRLLRQVSRLKTAVCRLWAGGGIRREVNIWCASDVSPLRIEPKLDMFGTILLDSHVLHWWSAEADQLSSDATKIIELADELAIPVHSWLDGLRDQVRTMAGTSAIADTATSRSKSFPGDPPDRLIYATAVELGWRLVTTDRRLRGHKHPSDPTVW